MLVMLREPNNISVNTRQYTATKQRKLSEQVLIGFVQKQQQVILTGAT